METVAKDSPAPVDPMVYRDLLIFEESLRSHFSYLQNRRHKYLVFVCGLLLWLAYFTYGTMIAPSQYYYIHIFHRLSLLGGLFTLILYYVSSLLHKTLIYPKKYISHTNKSLRQFNLKLVPNPVSNPWRNLPVLRWIFRCKPMLGEGGVKVVLNQRGGIEGEFIEGWEMFREDFWEEEEKRVQEEKEKAKREGRRPSTQQDTSRPGTGRAKAPGSANGTRKKKKKGSVSGSVSSVKTSSTGSGSVKEKPGKKKKKLTAEQAVVGL